MHYTTKKVEKYETKKNTSITQASPSYVKGGNCVRALVEISPRAHTLIEHNDMFLK